MSDTDEGGGWTMHRDDDEEFDDEYDDGCEAECYWCGGDGWGECDRPLDDCMKRHFGGLCPCSSCGGSGLAKDMTIW